MLLTTPYTLPNVIQYDVTTNGATVVVADNANTLILEPAGTIAAATVTLPSTNLYDGKVVTLSCSQIVTALTLNGGTIVSALTAFVAGGVADYTYRAANAKWYRTG